MVMAFCMLIALFPTTAFSANTSFKDVDSGSWYYDSVKYACEKGLMKGTAEDIFSPDSELTRAQLCQIFYNIEKEPAVTGNAFTDVSASSWYYSAVNWAANSKIVNGVGNGMFSPDSAVTREQMVTIMYNYSAYKEYDVDDIVSLTDFTDADTVSSWAETAMQWAVSEDIITGISATSIGPGSTATRAQAATILMRFCTNVEREIAFKAKDADDFKGYTVLNFDESNETNFAVLTKGAVVDDEVLDTNKLVRVDENTGAFTFDNIDNTIKTLKQGDIFYSVYGPGDDDYVLLKVGSIKIDGTTAAIIPGEAELSEYFEYVDIDMNVNVSDEYLAVGTSGNVSADMDFEILHGIEDISKNLTEPFAGIGPNVEIGVITDKFEATGGLGVTVNCEVKVDNKEHLEEVRFTIKTEGTIKAEIKAVAPKKPAKEMDKKESLGNYTVPVAAGLDVPLEMYFKYNIEAKATGSIEGSVKSEIGVKYDIRTGTLKEINENKSDFTAGVKGGFKVSFGIEGDACAQFMKVFRIGLTAGTGIEAKAETDVYGVSADKSEKHICPVCLDGEINLYAEAKYYLKAGIDAVILDVKIEKEITLIKGDIVKLKVKLKDFYISFLGGDSAAEIGLGECPHKEYLTTVTVKDENGKAVADVRIEIELNGDIKTDKNGNATIYLPNGEYKASLLSDDYTADVKSFTVKGKAVNVTVSATKKVTSDNRKVVHANTEEELRAAIASNTEVRLSGKTYYIDTSNSTGKESFIDINNVDNFALVGTSGTRIVVENVGGEGEPQALLAVNSCSNIEIKNLVIQTTNAPTVDVVDIGSSQNVSINNCQISGYFGLVSYDSSVSVTNTAFSKNYYMALGAGAKIVFNNCTFNNNGKVEIWGQEEISDYGFYIHDMYYGGSGESFFTFIDCKFNGNIQKYFHNMGNGFNDTYTSVINCTSTNNGWQ